MGEPQRVPAAPGNTNTVTVPLRTFNEVKTVSLAFVGDHQLLKDNEPVKDRDWANTGSRFPKPEFTYGKKSAPASGTKDAYLVVEVELEVWPYEAPQMDCTIKGAATWGQTFVTKLPLKGGKQKVILHSEEKLPDKVTKLSGDIDWTVDNGADGMMKADHAWGHDVYLTVATPVDLTTTKEAGITEKRMSTAVDLVGAAGSLDPHAIVGKLMERVPGYTIHPPPKVPDPSGATEADGTPKLVDDPNGPPRYFHHPDYWNDVGGAWPIAGYFRYSAECQAICRFVMAAIRQVGCPGTAEVVVVWADPDVDDGNTIFEAPLGSGGLGGHSTRTVSGVTWYAALVDHYPEEGKEYETEDENARNYLGLNNFEACLRFEHNGVKKYYGGGAGVYDSPQQVILAFYALCWMSRRNVGGKEGGRVEKVVKRWRGTQGQLLP
jgi:hypothetical protein